MCQALRELFADELEERENNGIKLGIEQGIASVIANMHQNGFTMQQIFMATGKDIDTVTKVLNKCNAS